VQAGFVQCRPKLGRVRGLERLEVKALCLPAGVQVDHALTIT
jgi:hypothetical protein